MLMLMLVQLVTLMLFLEVALFMLLMWMMRLLLDVHLTNTSSMRRIPVVLSCAVVGELKTESHNTTIKYHQSFKQP